MRLAFFPSLLILASLIFFGIAGVGRSEAAAPTNFVFGQHCDTDNTAQVEIKWTGDPSAREVWVDYDTTDSRFDAGAFSSDGPLSSRASSHAVYGLTPHSVYWFRINQLLPTGDWQPSQTQRYVVGCGNATAPAGKIQVTGFGDGSKEAHTPPDSTLKKCNPSTLNGYIHVTGLKQITDVTLVWYQGDTRFLQFATAYDETTTDRTSVATAPAGFGEGPYRLEVWTGGSGTWTLSARGSFTLDC